MCSKHKDLGLREAQGKIGNVAKKADLLCQTQRRHQLRPLALRELYRRRRDRGGRAALALEYA